MPTSATKIDQSINNLLCSIIMYIGLLVIGGVCYFPLVANINSLPAQLNLTI